MLSRTHLESRNDLGRGFGMLVACWVLGGIATARSQPDDSVSVGSPMDGKLQSGVALPLRGNGFHFNPLRDPAARFGTAETVQALVNAAAVVANELPGSELVINDLGYATGGPIPQHGSHQNGRDVDVLFYLLDARGKPRPSVGAPLDPQGHGWDFGDLKRPDDDQPLRFDARRTWRFVQALLEDRQGALQRIFIVEHLRSLLLEEGRKRRASAATLQRFAEVTCQPAHPHDDHLHLRFYCSAQDISAGCQDSPPLYPWQIAALRQQGVSAVLSRPRPSRSRAPTTSQAEARRRAGDMHWRVSSFLDRRNGWSKQPHPGRTYCR